MKNVDTLSAELLWPSLRQRTPADLGGHHARVVTLAVGVVDIWLVRLHALNLLGKPRIGVGRGDHKQVRPIQDRDRDLSRTRVEGTNVCHYVRVVHCLVGVLSFLASIPLAPCRRSIIHVLVVQRCAIYAHVDLVKGHFDAVDDRVSLTLGASCPRKARNDLDATR